MGAMSAGALEEDITAAREFGQKLGIIFQIRDDIFDYYDSAEIGKPTGNDMAEGKLTLPVIHAVLTTQNPEMLAIAYKVKQHEVTKEEIAQLVAAQRKRAVDRHAVVDGAVEGAVAAVDEIQKRSLAMTRLGAYHVFAASLEDHGWLQIYVGTGHFRFRHILGFDIMKCYLHNLFSLCHKSKARLAHALA